MKAAIHPNYNEIRVHCACGNTFNTRSTHKGDIHVEICSNCHPFFTGKQKLMDTAGRVERFRRKYAKAGEKKEAGNPRIRILAPATAVALFCSTDKILRCASSGTTRKVLARAPSLGRHCGPPPFHRD